MNNLKGKALDSTRTFWNVNPCDGQSDIERRMRYRYRKEPWLPPLLEAIACKHEAILEVGCGQGTDGIYICLHKKNGSYTGIDLSDKSIENAQAAAGQCAAQLGVAPLYKTGNAEYLEFPDHSFDAIYSCGVLHHTPDTHKAIQEVHRVLKQGGVGYVYLYRTASVKVFVAHLLRAISRFLDIITFQDRLVWKTIRMFVSSRRFGTMMLECFGVPILKSYTRGQLKGMFSGFSEAEISLPGKGISETGANHFFAGWHKRSLCTVWQIRCEK